MLGGEPVFIEVEGTRLWYEVLGEGPPLVVLHGGLGLDHSWFRPWLDPLADRSRLVYFDQRGNGRSERPSQFTPITHRTWIDDVDALRDRLGLGRIVLFGHSYGGLLAQEYALRFPETLDGLILCCTTPAFDYTDVVQANASARATPRQLAALTEAFSRPMADDSEWEETWLTLLPLYFAGEPPANLGDGAVYSCGAWNHVNANCLGGFDVTAELASIPTPSLVLSGAHDWLMPPTHGGGRIHSEVPDSELVVFDDSGHFPFVEEPAHFIEVVSDWLARLRARS